jgi:predicted phosphodiesterase
MALEAARAVFGAGLSKEAMKHHLGGHIIPHLAPVTPTQDARIGQLVALVKDGTRNLSDLCDAMDLPPKRVTALMETARAAGYRVATVDGRIGLQPTATSRVTTNVVLPPEHTGIFLVASDVHVGSQFFLREQFQDHIRRGYEEGARVCLVPGDILDGCYEHSRWEETHHGFHDQANECAKIFPRLDGLRYIGITGNHDQTFEHKSGLSVVDALPQVFKTAGRDDFSLIGARGAFVRLGEKGKRGLLVEMWHPLKGPAYALSYKMQKHIEGYQVGQKPDVLLTGHWHQACYFTQRGVHAMSCGTFHGGQSSFGKALGGAPAIGGWIVKYGMTKDGTVRDFAPAWRGYFEAEQIRDVGLT